MWAQAPQAFFPAGPLQHAQGEVLLLNLSATVSDKPRHEAAPESASSLAYLSLRNLWKSFQLEVHLRTAPGMLSIKIDKDIWTRLSFISSPGPSPFLKSFSNFFLKMFNMSNGAVAWSSQSFFFLQINTLFNPSRPTKVVYRPQGWNLCSQGWDSARQGRRHSNSRQLSNDTIYIKVIW